MAFIAVTDSYSVLTLTLLGRPTYVDGLLKCRRPILYDTQTLMSYSSRTAPRQTYIRGLVAELVKLTPIFRSPSSKFYRGQKFGRDFPPQSL